MEGIRRTIFDGEGKLQTHLWLASHFGHLVVNGIEGGKDEDYLIYHTRLAVFYGRLALEDRERADRNRAHREQVDLGFDVIKTAFGGRYANV